MRVDRLNRRLHKRLARAVARDLSPTWGGLKRDHLRVVGISINGSRISVELDSDKVTKRRFALEKEEP